MVNHLYVMSDTHDDLEAVKRAVDFMQSEGLEGARIIHAGDLALKPYTREALDSLLETRDVRTFLAAKTRHNEGVLRGYKELFDTSGIPYTVIPGNYDGSLTGIFGDCDIHNRAVKIEELTVAGYGGGGNLDEQWIGPGNIELLARFGEIELFNPNDLETLLRKNNPDIAVIHNPPYGLCDDMYPGAQVQHAGTPTSRRYLQENNNLKLVISGHIHEAGPNGNNPNGVIGIAAVRKNNGEIGYVVNPGNLGRFELVDSRTLETSRQFPYGTFVRVDIEDDGTPVNLTQYTVKEEGRTIGEVRVMRDIDLTKAA